MNAPPRAAAPSSPSALSDPSALSGPSAPSDTDAHPLILFDGTCNLCNGAVGFIIRHDRAGRFRFAPLQSASPRSDPPPAAYAADSFLLIEGDLTFDRSTAVLRIARLLGWPWKLFYGLMIVPRPWRDAFYDFIASHRYGWFGRRDRCMTPPPEWADRFPGSRGGTL